MVEIIERGNLTIRGMSAEEREELKELSTFKNPKYGQALRFSKKKVVYVPKTIEYFNEYSERDENGVRRKVMQVPIGMLDLFDLSESTEVILRDERVLVEQSYPKFLFDLRNDQDSAFKDYIDDPFKNVVQLRTGKGKTILALYIAQYLKQRTLVLVHKDDLVTGWKKDIHDVFGGKAEVGLVKAKSDKIGKHITIATVQTLAKKSDEYMEKFTNQFGLVVCDECHHIGANTFNIIDKFNSKYKLGLSATPTRTDGLTHCLNLYFGGLCHIDEFKADDEDLCKAEVIVRQGKFKFLPFVHDGLVLNYWDYGKIGEKDEYYTDIPFKKRPRLSFMEIDNMVVTDNHTKIQICKDIISEYKQGHNIIVFFTQKEHIRLYHSYLKRYIPDEKMQMFYGDNNEKSEVIMSRAESGQCTVTLATYSKATEGTNVKSWEVGILASSLNNDKNIKQCIGRLLRKKEGKLNPVRIYDYQFKEAYALDRHYLSRKKVYDEFEFNITGDVSIGRQLNI